MNNLLELTVMALEAVICLRSKGAPRLTQDVIDALETLRSAVLRQEVTAFESGDAALAWLRSVVQWDLLSVIVEMVTGRGQMGGGPLFVQGFVEATQTAVDLSSAGKIDARRMAQTAIEVGQSKAMFQILRAQHFEDLLTDTLEKFVEQEQRP